MPLKIDRAWIERRIPHQGRMCLIDEVVEWSAERIVCSSGGHRAADHPLRSHGRLGIACGIELAAQAMAVHGAILAEGSEGRPRAGLLASVRGVRLWVLRLDDVRIGLALRGGAHHGRSRDGPVRIRAAILGVSG